MAAVLRMPRCVSSGDWLSHTENDQEQIRMRTLSVVVVGMAALFLGGPLQAQMGGRLSAEPYVGYGFFGELPDGRRLEADIAYGGRVAYRLSPQWAGFGNFQRSTPSALTVDHWSAGIEFSYVPRGGAEGMLPILLEAGLGQARYAGGTSDRAVSLGLASAVQVTDNIALRYGANDYISNYRNGDGIVNQIFVRVGAEVAF
jgi:hypothetical protein